MFHTNVWSCLDEGLNVFDHLITHFSHFSLNFTSHSISPVALNQGSAIFNFWQEWNEAVKMRIQCSVVCTVIYLKTYWLLTRLLSEKGRQTQETVLKVVKIQHVIFGPLYSACHLSLTTSFSPELNSIWRLLWLKSVVLIFMQNNSRKFITKTFFLGLATEACMNMFILWNVLF